MTTKSTQVELAAARELEKCLSDIGPSEAVERFIGSYGKLRTRKLYASHLRLYFRWLKKDKHVEMGPDDLIVDNLRCIFKSEAEDVATKRKHRALLESYLNQGLFGRSESHRRIALAVVKGFYEKNDSALFGKVRIAEQNVAIPDQALKADDIRKVLRVLPLAIRTPLLLMWQSGCEINRVLGLRWKDLEGLRSGEYPLRLSFYGRKRHRKAYYTFLGRDSIQHLKLWRGNWEEVVARSPQADELVFLGKRQTGMTATWLNQRFRATALKLAKQGITENSSAESWHSHSLRHSFRTEAAHAGIKSEIVEYLMGHEGGIARVYDQRDEIHPEDFVAAYKTLEPLVSLDYTETVMSEQFESREKMLLSKILQIQKDYEELKREVLSRTQTPHQSLQGGT